MDANPAPDPPIKRHKVDATSDNGQETKATDSKEGSKPRITQRMEASAAQIAALKTGATLPLPTLNIGARFIIVFQKDGGKSNGEKEEVEGKQKGGGGVWGRVSEGGSEVQFMEEFTNEGIERVYDMESMFPPEWNAALSGEFSKHYWAQIKEFLFEKDRLGRTIHPPIGQIFAAFQHCPKIDEIRGVIIGQDPYHGLGQAHGLAFSVPSGIAIPSSLSNIFTELSSDIRGFKAPKSGCLTGWAKQGILLLNTALTVTHQHPASHSRCGWNNFTDAVLRHLNAHAKNHLVFFAWGKHAQTRAETADLGGLEKTRLVLRAAHPSGHSAEGGFFGCGHFSAANRFWTDHGRTPIDWAKTE